MRALDYAIAILLLIASTSAVMWLTPSYNNSNGLSTGNSTSTTALTAQYQLNTASALYPAVVGTSGNSTQSASGAWGYDPLTYLYQMTLGALTMLLGIFWIYFQAIPFLETVLLLPVQIAAIIQIVLYFAALLAIVQFFRGVFFKPME